jgi:hypothetical protein
MESTSRKLTDWYRKFNFLVGTLNTFDKILSETESYFSAAFPFLNNISKLIILDLNVHLPIAQVWILKLKDSYNSLKESNVTAIELNEIETKILQFSQSGVSSL